MEQSDADAGAFEAVDSNIHHIRPRIPQTVGEDIGALVRPDERHMRSAHTLFEHLDDALGREVRRLLHLCNADSRQLPGGGRADGDYAHAIEHAWKLIAVAGVALFGGRHGAEHRYALLGKGGLQPLELGILPGLYLQRWRAHDLEPEGFGLVHRFLDPLGRAHECQCRHARSPSLSLTVATSPMTIMPGGSKLFSFIVASRRDSVVTSTL